MALFYFQDVVPPAVANNFITLVKYWDNGRDVYSVAKLSNNVGREESEMRIDYALPEVAPQAFSAEMPERPAAVVECFVRLVEAGEIGAAVGLLSKELVTRVGFEKLESIFSEGSAEIRSAGGIEYVDVQTVAFSRDHVEMRLSIQYGDHKIESEAVQLVRENDRWKISMEEVSMAGAN